MGEYPQAWGRTLAGLYDELTGAAPGFEGNDATRYGQETEPLARAAFNAERAVEDPFVPMCAVHASIPQLRASIDGVSVTRDELLEIKCPFKSKRLLDGVSQHGLIPTYYYAQIQHLLMVTGCRSTHFYVYYKTPKREQVTTAAVEVLPNPAYIRTLVARELAFWEDVVYGRRPADHEYNARRAA